ncbi:MAG: flippase-like domain-containing protein [Candidatus Omnitrophica bacterium]|nr:flippase-like domain-containing protein [Candidatus Omnitrophota bacterium]
MNKSKITLTLRILFSSFLLALLLWLMRENFTKIWQLLSSVKLPLFGLAFLLFAIATFLLAVRLKLVLAAQNANFKIKELYSLTLIGYFFTNFMPTSVGGDLVKGYYISKKNTKLTSYSSIFVDRFIGMLSLVSIAVIALLFTTKETQHGFVFWTIGFLFLSCSLFVLLLTNKKLLKKILEFLGFMRLIKRLKLDSLLKRAYDSINSYANQKTKLLPVFALSFVSQFIVFVSIHLLINSLSAQAPFGKILFTMPIVFALCNVPITMNGLGLREWGFVFFLSPNIGEAAAISASFLYLAMFLMLSVLGGITYLFRR